MRLWSSRYERASVTWGENTNPIAGMDRARGKDRTALAVMRLDDQKWKRLTSGACWIINEGGPLLGLYVFEGDDVVKVDWLDGVQSRSGVGAFADLLQRGVVTFFKPGGTDGKV